jgi:hypothetical protein
MRPVFDPVVLHACARAGVGKARPEMFDAVIAALVAAYPGRIQRTDLSWILNNAGGAMGQLSLLHASLGEYLLFFGSPIGTEGHSGRYRTEVWDFVLAGEAWCYLEGELERTCYGPGDAMVLPADRVKGYRIPDHCWMLEYARGPIPTMLPFGLADSVLSTLDFTTIGRTLAQYVRMVTDSLVARPLRRLGAAPARLPLDVQPRP